MEKHNEQPLFFLFFSFLFSLSHNEQPLFSFFSFFSFISLSLWSKTKPICMHKCKKQQDLITRRNNQFRVHNDSNSVFNKIRTLE